MGLFGSRKETHVASVVYNLAGDEKDRADYLKTTVIGSILHERPSIADVIKDAYLKGPGMRFRSFAKWSRSSGYADKVGLVTGNITSGNSIDLEALVEEIEAPEGYTVQIQTASIGEADYSYWVDQYIAENYPERLYTNYTTDFNETSNTVIITWDDETTTTFNPVGFNRFARYLYVSYQEVSETDQEGNIEEGDIIFLDPEEEFPPVDDWTEINYEETDDGFFGSWERVTYMGQDPDSEATYSLKEYMFQTEEGEDRYYQINTQKIFHRIHAPVRVMIYAEGSGNPVLDSMFEPSENIGEFFPFIPFRIDNEFVSESNFPVIYQESKKAYKKSLTGRFDKTIKDLEDNESLDDIDYAYVVFGVSLNVLEVACRKYIYKFFQTILRNAPDQGSAKYQTWKTQFDAAKASWLAWGEWMQAQDDPEDPAYGTPEPVRLPYPAMPDNEVRITSENNPAMNFDMTISWYGMTEETGAGLAKPDAKVGDLWFEQGTGEDFEEVLWHRDGDEWKQVPGKFQIVSSTELYWQETPTLWRKITFIGLRHTNTIYGGKSVVINAKDALEDPEESGFIIPLHEGIYREMGMVDGTQMATASAFMVFNCYEVTKRKWYQTGIFKVILIIIVIVVSIYTGGAGAGASAGLLGTNAAVGAALGFTGTMAIVVGAIANAIAAMLLTKAITTGATALFGEKWGAIIGAIASIIALQVGTSMATGQSFSASFGDLMRADNILKLTMAAGDGYAGYLAAATQRTLQQTQDVIKQYEEESRKIRELWVENIGTSRGIIDPLELTESFGVTMESMDSFLQRTLMSGSDVADFSLDLLTNFVDITLSTELST